MYSLTTYSFPLFSRYDAYDHIGYDVSGTKVLKRKGKDRIDAALNQRDNPDASKTVYDMYNDREVVLSK